MKMVSAITIAVLDKGDFLLFRKGRSGWGFAYEKFDGKLNGNLDDTARRAATKFIGQHEKMEYIGSFIKAGQGKMFVMYDFIVRGFSGKPKLSKRVKRSEIQKESLDENTLAFLKVHGRLL